MSLCCIGGVCVPYSAVIPIFFLALRWLLEQAVKLGLVPESVMKQFFPASSKYAPVAEGECTNGTASCCSTATTSTSCTTGTVLSIETEDQFRDVLKQPQVICKFTADWCKPCKEIQPVFESLAKTHTNAIFCTIDVDELDDIASEYKVAMMPTFLYFKNGHVQDTKSGIDLLEDFVQKALA